MEHLVDMVKQAEARYNLALKNFSEKYPEAQVFIEVIDHSISHAGEKPFLEIKTTVLKRVL